MKHATAAALADLAGLLQQIRIRPGIKEKTAGIFYRKSRSFLHFHEDPAGLFADLRARDEFIRFPVNDRAEWQALLSAVDQALGIDEVLGTS